MILAGARTTGDPLSGCPFFCIAVLPVSLHGCLTLHVVGKFDSDMPTRKETLTADSWTRGTKHYQKADSNYCSPSRLRGISHSPKSSLA